MPRVYDRLAEEERFWNRVNKNGPEHPTLGRCWLWTGPPHGDTGYARVGHTYVHRYAYAVTYGPIPADRRIQVLHSCDVSLCVNPRHLWLGTAKRNEQDKILRGRKPQGAEVTGSKLTEDQVREIRERYRTTAVTYLELAREYGVNKPRIGQIIRRVAWKHVE